MARTVLGVFADRQDAEGAVHALRKIDYNVEDISIIMKDSAAAHDIADDTGTGVVEGAATGATTGAMVGALAGLLVGVGIIPGLGAFLIGGPLAASLGLTGAAATTLSGAATGALAGGLLGALMSFGLSEDEARVYEEHINEGAILLAVPTESRFEKEVIDILNDYDAAEIRSIGVPEDPMERVDTNDDYSYTDRTSYDDPSYTTYGVKGGESRSDVEDDLIDEDTDDVIIKRRND